MLRGDIWTAGGPSSLSKPRPVVVIQSDLFDATGTVTVCPLTTTDIGASTFRVAVPVSEDTGLIDPSFVMIDKVESPRRANLDTRVGAVDAATMIQVERSLAVFLGIGQPKD